MENATSEFDTCVEATDWRSSATILGLIRYLEYIDADYNREQILSKGEDKDWDILRFNQSVITKERYLEFAEYYFEDQFYHKSIESAMQKSEFTKEEITEINKKLVGNTILKKIFQKVKFDGENQAEILKLVDEHREEIVQETFRNKKNLYANFCNPNQLFNEAQDYCRLNGYYIDGPKKGKSVSYQFNTSTYVSTDMSYYDFIVFAFTNGRESFFINDNSSIEQIVASNDKMKHDVDEAKKTKAGTIDNRRILFESIIKSADFLDYDVEVIVKNQENGYFETLFIRKESIDILKSIRQFTMFCFSYKVTENYYINVQKEVINHILNLLRLDQLIDFFLKESIRIKDSTRFQALVTQLISVNESILMQIREHRSRRQDEKGENGMTISMKSTYACAREVVDNLSKRNLKNKITSYRTKLISAIVLNDADRFCDILIQLAQYTNVQFNFAYDLFEDFDANKDVAYTFVNALCEKELETKKEDKKNEK